jgi:hypothetical protein
MTPRSSHEFEHSSPAHNLDGGGDGGLGNLADELGDVWDEDDEGAEVEYMDEMDLPPEEINGIGVAIDHDGSAGLEGSPTVNGVRDSGVAMQSSSPESKATLSPQAAVRQNGRRHQRQRSLYDGSDYGDDSDLEANEGISAGLEKQMAVVESLVRRGLEENGSPSDQVVKRVVDRLRDLGSQSTIETGATRYACRPYLDTHLTRGSLLLQAQDRARRCCNTSYPPISDFNILNRLVLRPSRCIS